MRAGSLTVACPQFCRRYQAEPQHQPPAKCSSWSRCDPSVRAVTASTWCEPRHFAQLGTIKVTRWPKCVTVSGDWFTGRLGNSMSAVCAVPLVLLWRKANAFAGAANLSGCRGRAEYRQGLTGDPLARQEEVS